MAETESPSTIAADATNGEMDDTILTLPNNIAVRRYQLSDAPSLAHHGNNKKIWNNLRNRMPQPYTEEAAQWWINHTNDPANCVKSGPWTAETGSQGPLLPTNYTITHNGIAIGSIGFEANPSNEVYAHTAEIGYWLGEEYWGQGIMGTVAPAFVEWVFETFEIVVRIEAGVYDRNKGSQRVLQKAGFVVEGWRRCRYVKNGIVGDEMMHGLVRPGFEKEEK